jgi:hypothetical protein
MPDEQETDHPRVGANLASQNLYRVVIQEMYDRLTAM